MLLMFLINNEHTLKFRLWCPKVKLKVKIGVLIWLRCITSLIEWIIEIKPSILSNGGMKKWVEAFHIRSQWVQSKVKLVSQYQILVDALCLSRLILDNVELVTREAIRIKKLLLFDSWWKWSKHKKQKSKLKFRRAWIEGCDTSTVNILKVEGLMVLDTSSIKNWFFDLNFWIIENWSSWGNIDSLGVENQQQYWRLRVQ